MYKFQCCLKFRIYFDNYKTNNTYTISSIKHTKLKEYQKEVNLLISKLKNKNMKKKLDNIINDSISYDPEDIFQYFNFKIEKMENLKDLEFKLEFSIHLEKNLPKIKEIKKSSLKFKNNPETLLSKDALLEHISSCLDNHYTASEPLVEIKSKEMKIGEMFYKSDIKKGKLLM